MDDTLFWRIVGEAYRPDPVEQTEALRAALETLPWFEVVDFRAELERRVAAADAPDLRAAALVVNGEATDRGFRDFRLGLVAAGRRAYDAAVRDPDSLADFLDGDPLDGFGLDGVAVRVYEAKAGASDFYAKLAERHPDLPPAVPPVAWAPPPEDELRQRLPNLCRMYLTETEDDA